MLHVHMLHSLLPVAKSPHKRSQYSSVWKQKKTEDEGGNNNTFRQSDKRVHTRGHSKVRSTW